MQLPVTRQCSDSTYTVQADSAYSTYVAVFYVLAAAILGIVFTTVWVTLLLRKDDNSGAWLKR